MPKIKSFFKFLLIQGRECNILNLSAQMSYRILLAFIPFLMLIYNFINILSQRISYTLSYTIFSDVAFLLPQSLLDYFQFAQENAMKVPNSGSSNIIILFFILSVSISASYSLILSLNRIFKAHEQREFIALWIQAFIYFVLFLAIILLMLIIYGLSEYVIYYLSVWFQLSSFLSIFFNLFTAIYFFIVLTITLTLIYMFAPKKMLELRHSLPGAIFVSFLWVNLFIVYRLFIHSNLDFANFFTNLQGPFILLFEVYLVAFSLNLGGIVNLYSLKYFEKKGVKHDQ